MEYKRRLPYIKYIFAAVIFAALLVTAAAPLAAAGAEIFGLSREYPIGEAPRFIDDAGLTDTRQAAALNEILDEISLSHQFDVVIVTVRALDRREARLFAADFYEYHEYGFGEFADGIILLLATVDRDFGLATSGYGYTAFTDAGQEYLNKHFQPYLRADDYYTAFNVFAEATDDFLTRAKAGNPYKLGNIPLLAEERAEYRRNAAIASIIIALLSAVIVTSVWKSKLKSVRRQDLAHNYIRGDSMKLKTSRDIFLYRRVSKIRRETNNSGSGGGGGSFRSSSGRSFSGRSGKY